MKKLIVLCTVFLMTTLLMFTSCKPTTADKGPVEYCLSVAGATEGAVDLAYQNAVLNLDGQATLNLSIKSDTIYHIADYITAANKKQSISVYSLDQVLTDTTLVCDKKTIEAANRLNKTAIFDVTTTTGTYDLTIKGYIREPITGITLYVNRHLTNKQKVSSKQ